MFGYGDPNNTKLSPFKNNLTETFAFILYGTFHIAVTIILMNMLIAMLAKSYDSVQVKLEIVIIINNCLEISF